jgi:hypothetical protein
MIIFKEVLVMLWTLGKDKNGKNILINREKGLKYVCYKNNYNIFIESINNPILLPLEPEDQAIRFQCPSKEQQKEIMQSIREQERAKERAELEKMRREDELEEMYYDEEKRHFLGLEIDPDVLEEDDMY